MTGDLYGGDMPRATRIALLVGALTVLASGCSASVLSLDVGECFDDWEGSLTGATQEVTDVPIVDCAEPHDNEVYTVSNMPTGPFPGDAGIEEWTIARCEETFDGYVGTAYLDSRLDFGALFPTEETWADGDTEVICFLWDSDFLKLTGSMQGSGI
jgi:hypothetical protein